MTINKSALARAYFINYSIKLLFLLIALCCITMLFWMTLNRHEIPVSVIFQSDTTIATLANNIVNQSFNNFIVVIFTMSAAYCILKNKECLIMKRQCHCGQAFTAILSTNDNHAGGKNFICPGCEKTGWIDAHTGAITLFAKQEPGYLEKIIHPKN